MALYQKHNLKAIHRAKKRLDCRKIDLAYSSTAVFALTFVKLILFTQWIAISFSSTNILSITGMAEPVSFADYIILVARWAPIFSIYLYASYQFSSCKVAAFRKSVGESYIQNDQDLNDKLRRFQLKDSFFDKLTLIFMGLYFVIACTHTFLSIFLFLVYRAPQTAQSHHSLLSPPLSFPSVLTQLTLLFLTMLYFIYYKNEVTGKDSALLHDYRQFKLQVQNFRQKIRRKQ